MAVLSQVPAIARRYGAALSLLAIAVGAIWTVGMYVDSRIARSLEDARREQEQERQWRFDVRKEFQKPFYQRRMELCLEASDAAAVLATTADATAAGRARDAFWRLYWGPLVAVEEADDNSPTGVVAAMVTFGGMLREACPAPPCRRSAQACSLPCAAPRDEAPQCLQCASLNLARACRQLIAESWQLPGKP